MEAGRNLGASFQGMERLVFEQRRACHLLDRGRSGNLATRLHSVFSDKPPPPATIRALLKERERSFPHVVAGAGRIERDERADRADPGASRAQHKRVLVVPRNDVRHIIGAGGATIKHLELTTWAKVEVSNEGDTAEVSISGSAAAVKACIESVQQLLSQHSQRAPAQSSYYATGPPARTPAHAPAPAAPAWESERPRRAWLDGKAGKGGKGGKGQARPTPGSWDWQPGWAGSDGAPGGHGAGRPAPSGWAWDGAEWGARGGHQGQSKWGDSWTHSGAKPW